MSTYIGNTLVEDKGVIGNTLVEDKGVNKNLVSLD